MDEIREFIVDPPSAKERLDRFLARVTGFSRSRIQFLIEEGFVRVNGRPEKPSHRLLLGERVHLTLPPPEPEELSPEPIPLSILYEDGEILVLDKPAGLIVHPVLGSRSGTLVNALLAYDPAFRNLGEKGRPGIVHRLDKETSGVLVVARTEAAKLELQRQFQARWVKKVYLALVHGEVKGEGRIEMPIGRHEEDRKRMGIKTRKGREAVTTYRVLEHLGGMTLLEVLPETGRTHQIRVHLSALGYPVLGDRVYGGRRERKGKAFLSTLGLRPGRHFLHAWKLGFFHPKTGEWMELEAPLPEDFEAILSALRGRGSPP